MRGAGGFEGNAQTLRILARVEKKRTDAWPPVEFSEGADHRRGLNLTMRSLASILKYDEEILPRAANDRFMKGYYADERELVRNIKEAVAGDAAYPDFKTVECQIMDIADDIAYSTYDLEDAMKVGFSPPITFREPRRLLSSTTFQSSSGNVGSNMLSCKGSRHCRHNN